MGSSTSPHLGGGAGGIIQIISAAGLLSPKALSLKRGTSVGTCTPEAQHGYYFIAGNFLWHTIQKLKEQGKLIFDGGNGKLRSGAASRLGGGAGGIIQIISPAGCLPLNALSLRRGTKVETCTETNEHAFDITILQEVISFSGPSRNVYSLCALTRSDECVHVVGQYMKPIASNSKIAGGGGKRRERYLRCNSFTNQLKSKAISVQPNISQI